MDNNNHRIIIIIDNNNNHKTSTDNNLKYGFTWLHIVQHISIGLQFPSFEINFGQQIALTITIVITVGNIAV